MVRLTYDDRLRCDGEAVPAAIDFLDTRFFAEQDDFGSSRQLPEPAAVRASRPDQTSGKVAFEDLGVFIKFGQQHKVSIEEAQAMQAIRRALPDSEIPVPELIAWRSIEDINFIYMSYVKGSTLTSSWSDLTQEEKSTISDQLRRMTDSLRSIEHDHTEPFIGP